MFKRFASILLRNKLFFTIIVLLSTAYMGYEASKMELSYEFAKILPANDPSFVEYKQFKKDFGSDGNIMVIGFADTNFFTLNKFNDWYHLSKAIKIIPGIKDVVSVPTSYTLARNDSLRRFDIEPLIKRIPRTQRDVDSLRDIFMQLPFYEGIVFNKESSATLMAITFNSGSLDSKRRIEIVKEVKTLTEAFSDKHRVEMHYSGMPFIRTQLMEKISSEMTLFLILAIIITALILWLFFRSTLNVFFSIVIVAIGVIWSVGILQLFDYKITALTGLIPPLIMVIGIPNCVFLINKYQSEYVAHKNRVKALSRMIETIGITLFLANVTTSIGFGVLYFTESALLVEFGIVAAISVMATYLLTLILVPIILFLLPAPKAKHTKHLEGKRINRILSLVEHLVHKKRREVYITTFVLTILGAIGMFNISFVGFVVDDLPERDPVYTDLKFFEKHFKGVLPFEIVIDTKSPDGVFANDAKTLYKIKSLQSVISKYDEFSKPVSIVEAIKFSNQSFQGGAKKHYILPGLMNLKSLSEYYGTFEGQDQRLRAFIDSSRSRTRISFQMADIGSDKTKALMAELKPKVDEIFDPAEYEVDMTGHSLVFLKSNDYLLYNLLESLVIEIILISIVGMALFRSVRIIILSKLPCLIPLIITAGVMGFLDIRFKPSTILIFSIAFGISSDGTIYLLTKYRQELKKMGGNAVNAINKSIREIGLSMVYTTVILFFGFSIFSVSSFGGTAALGILISLTLIMSLITNLVLLPSILLTINNKKQNKEIVKDPLISVDDE
ncbi:MAG: efflux RND transporter permease subunit [Bacteroidota bacterium]|jgi:predicted RND superfamily exporter protein